MEVADGSRKHRAWRRLVIDLSLVCWHQETTMPSGGALAGLCFTRHNCGAYDYDRVARLECVVTGAGAES